MQAQTYFHGFEEPERQRLLRQADVLAPLIYKNVDYSNCKSILEIGSGVGAQTLQLLKRFPKLKITCVERSEIQLQAARENLKDYLSTGQIQLIHSAAESLPLEDESFDAVFICWVLEHVKDPSLVLKEAKRVMKSDAKIFIREVFNTIFYTGPSSPELMLAWNEYNQKQISMGGDPFVGAKLGHLLNQLGFVSIDLKIASHLYDSRNSQELANILEYWEQLFLSGFSDREKIEVIQREFKKLKEDLNTVFCFGFIEGAATA